MAEIVIHRDVCGFSLYVDWVMLVMMMKTTMMQEKDNVDVWICHQMKN